MDFAEKRKEHTKWSINQNPITITIKRTEKKRSGGGFKKIESTAGPFTVRIYMKSNQAADKEVTTLAGSKQVSTTWSMLTDADADVRSGANVKDEFETDMGKFLVVSVNPQMIHGEITGYQVSLERMT